jgi:hypothetical protein
MGHGKVHLQSITALERFFETGPLANRAWSDMAVQLDPAENQSVIWKRQAAKGWPFVAI